MIRGITIFKCEKCGHTFVGPDIEWHASAATAPLKCPKCGGNSICNSSKLVKRTIQPKEQVVTNKYY